MGGEVRLDDLGTVTDTIAEPRTFARFDGEPVVGLQHPARQGRERRHGRGVASKRSNAIKPSTPKSS